MKAYLFLVLLIIPLGIFGQVKSMLIVGCDYNYPPYSFIDKNGNPAGYDIDVMDALVKLTGFEVEYRLDKWSVILNDLDSGKVDLVTSIVFSADRESKYDFSFPLHTEFYAVFVKKGSFIHDINDLGAGRPAILEGDISISSFYKPMGLYNEYKLVRSSFDALRAVSTGTCDYCILLYPVGMKLINQKNISDIEVIGSPVLPSVFCYAVNENQFELLARINQGIEILNRSGELDKIYGKWVSYRSQDEYHEEYLNYLLITIYVSFAIIIALLGFWYFLQKQVKNKVKIITQQERIYQIVFNAIDDALVIVDEFFFIKDINQYVLYLPDVAKTELIGKNLFEVFEAKNKDVLLRLFSNIENNAFYVHDDRIILRGVVYFVSMKIFSIYVDNNKQYLLLIRNVTNERLNLKKIKKAKKLIEAANHAKSTFLSTISHEIRTPLFAIIGYTDILLKQNTLKKQEEYIRKIKLSGNILLTLVNDILDMSKIENGGIELIEEYFNIHDVVSEIYHVANLAALEKNVELILDIADAVPENLFGDKIRLLQILLNIVGNAIKFTEKGNVSVLVRVSAKMSVKNRVEIIFIVKDCGIGIPKADISNIFKAFVQVGQRNTKYGGTGLGLSISKQLAILMGGDIFVESVVGEGSSFFIHLPFRVVDENIKVIKSDFRRNVGEQKISVLLVEDNPFNAEILIEELSSKGFLVKHANSGVYAIELLRKNSAVYHIIIMDIEMPVLNGFETMKSLHELGLNKIPVIALSAHYLHLERENALKLGMLDYLCKPIKIDDLVNAIHKYKHHSINRFGDDTVIDIEKALIYFSHKEKYYVSLRKFKKYYGNLVERLFVLYKQKEFSELKNYMHNMKSASKFIGATLLFDLSRKYDEILRNNPELFTYDDVSYFNKELNRLIIRINYILEEKI